MEIQKNIHWLVWALLIIVTIIGLPLAIMEPDAALYAGISKTMYLNDDFINLYVHGYDWLDKPHLPFWIIALSFKLFGVNTIAYKLPGVLIFFYGTWLTYKFTLEKYNKKTAIIASLILATSQHSILSNFDVRAEPFLTGFIIASLYWFHKYITNKKFTELIIACFFAGLAMMTKGIFALIPIAFAIGGEFIVKRKWKELFNPMWLVAIMLMLIFILPELYALYLQFDLHPEKNVFGRNDVSGLKFFFWDSQFGRFFNNGPIKGHGDKFFFIHTILWAFLPWGLLFYLASFFKIKRNIKKVNNTEEFYTLFGTLFTILIFSLSKFQLPHYTNIIFPFMAIITADFIVKLIEEYKKLYSTYKFIQYLQIVIGTLLIGVIFYFVRPAHNFIFWIVTALSLGFIAFVFKNERNTVLKIFYTSCIVFLCINSFLFTHFYPTLFKYYAGINSAKVVNENYNGKVYLLDDTFGHYGFEFYLKEPVNRIGITDLDATKHTPLFVTQKQLKTLNDNNIKYKVIKDFNDFNITQLNAKFLNKKTRNENLNKIYLLQIL